MRERREESEWGGERRGGETGRREERLSSDLRVLLLGNFHLVVQGAVLVPAG